MYHTHTTYVIYTCVYVDTHTHKHIYVHSTTTPKRMARESGQIAQDNTHVETIIHERTIVSPFCTY